MNPRNTTFLLLINTHCFLELYPNYQPTLYTLPRSEIIKRHRSNHKVVQKKRNKRARCIKRKKAGVKTPAFPLQENSFNI